ncbi:glucosamine-6-phosphate deaminase [Corynebacterium sp. H127]|uniref:glucosamine-6-phosphate deaminase n=1 Tax=Corynebacterium sp. H127 TaxID=3133418 RepID=UPI0030A025C7
MEILIKQSAAEVAIHAADIMASYVTPGAVLGLATGSTPLQMYRELISRCESGQISFAGTQAFLLDEYIGLPREHDQSYYRFIREEFTSHIDIDDAQVHSPNGLAGDIHAEGPAYDAAIAAAGGVDIQLLGIGSNGHIGFNEPASSLTSGTRVETLHPQTVKDNARFFDGEESQVPVHVLTQGLGTISKAGHLLLIATGANKAHAVRDMIEGPLSAHCPASILQLHPKATVIVDEAAAALLDNSDYYRFCAANKI